MTRVDGCTDPGGRPTDDTAPSPAPGPDTRQAKPCPNPTPGVGNATHRGRFVQLPPRSVRAGRTALPAEPGPLVRV